MRGLIRPEEQSSPCTFHNSIWIETAEHAGFVILRRIQDGCDGVVWVNEKGLARWTATFTGGGMRKTESVCTFEAKYMPDLSVLCGHGGD